jgi:hypothetical protein
MQVIKGDKEDALHLFAALVLAAALRAILHFIPVAGPFLAPFKGAFTANTDLGRKAILNPRSVCHNPHPKGDIQVERVEGSPYSYP